MYSVLNSHNVAKHTDFCLKSYCSMWLPLVMQAVSRRALQWCSKCYCVASVTKTFTLKGAQTIHRWRCSTPCEALFETSCVCLAHVICEVLFGDDIKVIVVRIGRESVDCIQLAIAARHPQIVDIFGSLQTGAGKTGFKWETACKLNSCFMIDCCVWCSFAADANKYICFIMYSCAGRLFHKWT
jgi:hypothetical protein